MDKLICKHCKNELTVDNIKDKLWFNYEVLFSTTEDFAKMLKENPKVKNIIFAE